MLRMTTRLLLTCCALAVLAGCTKKMATSVSKPARGQAKPAVRQDPARFRDAVAVSQLREQAWDMLSVMARGEEQELRANALEAMAQTPQRLEALVVPALKDENPGVRSTAAMMVGRVPLRAIAPAARPLLNDPSPFVRASAVYALSRCGLEVDLTPLATMLLSDPSPRVRAHVAFLLGEMGEPSAAGLLREAAKAAPRSDQAEMKLLLAQISEALVKLGDQSQIEPLRAALYPSRPEDLEITALAVQIIGQLRDRGSTDELIYLTAYRDGQGNRMPAEIRLAAAASLAKLGLDQGTFVADEYASNELAVLRAQAAYVYGEIGRSENLAKLEQLMSDAAGIVRVAAAGAVLKIGSNPGAAASAPG